MKKIIVLISCLLALSNLSEAQNYDSAIGLRFGFPAGLTYKQFVNDNTAFEVIVGGSKNNTSITALIELHSEALDQSLNVVYGVGAHIGSLEKDLNVGADGIFGLEFTSSRAVFAIDIKPTLSLWRSNIRTSTGGAFTVRYAL